MEQRRERNEEQKNRERKEREKKEKKAQDRNRSLRLFLDCFYCSAFPSHVLRHRCINLDHFIPISFMGSNDRGHI